MSETAIRIENLKKQYRLGAIGGGTLNADLQSWWARKRHKEDPNLKIGQSYEAAGETFWALKGINLEVQKGEALGIIGANGAGKSTLLKILSRVTAPTEGDIWINGRVSSMLEVGTGFHGELTGRENIYMNGAILGMTKKEIDAKMESIIDFSECRQFIDTPVKRYSSGMYVKLAFSVASHLDAEIMIMDEVLAVGDMAFQKRCLGRMGDEAASGKTILYVSHNMATIRSLCSRCVVLHQGKISYVGDVEDAISQYLKEDHGELMSLYELEGDRRGNRLFGIDFRLTSFSFEKDSPVYVNTETIRFDIGFRSDSLYDDVQLFFHLHDEQTGAPITLMLTEKIDMSKQHGRFEMNIVYFAEGIYSFQVGALRMLPDGSHITLDRSMRKILFQVIRQVTGDYPTWHNQIYGSVVLPHIKSIVR